MKRKQFDFPYSRWSLRVQLARKGGDAFRVFNVAICCWTLVFLEGFSQGAVWCHLQ